MVNLAFLKKKTSDVIPSKGFTPTDRVKELAGRGFSEPEMIDVLRREGFSPRTFIFCTNLVTILIT